MGLLERGPVHQPYPFRVPRADGRAHKVGPVSLLMIHHPEAEEAAGCAGRLANGIVVRAASLRLFVLLIQPINHHLGDVELGVIVDHFAV